MDLYKLTAHELSKMLRERKVGAVELAKAHLDRIKQTDSEVESFITLCEDEAITSAKKVQDKLDGQEAVSPLAGIPMAIKDNICTLGIKTSCGSKMLENFVPVYNATVSDKLLSQDAILLGKLNMDEFAMGGSTENSYFKKTKNPWNLSCVPGGSSGGSAASVAADQVTFSLGSDTGGSIRQPASLCGVVGLKPTYGAVSRYGLVAFASSLDQIGPFTKDVEDCALVMNAITGYDSLDSTSANIQHPDYTKSLKKDITGLRIGIPKEYLGEGLQDEVRNSILEACEVFRKQGAICEEFSLPNTEYAIPAYYMISSAEASSNLARYDGIKYGFSAKQFSDLSDLYKQTRSEGFGAEVKRRIMLGTYALSSGYYDAYYKKALQVRTLIKNSFDDAFNSYDLILGPTSPTTAFKIGEKCDNPLEMYLMDIYTVSVNIAGLPGISIPCGFDRNKLPIGMQLIGKPFEESTILQAAYSFEQSTDYHTQKPTHPRPLSFQ